MTDESQKNPQKNKTWHQIWTEVDRLDILQAEKNTVNPRQSKCTSGITFNKPLQTKCYMLKNNSLLPTGGHRVDYEEQASKVRASTRLSMAPNAGSESVMAVRGADMWAFGRGEKRPVAAEIQRGNKDGGGRAALSASWGLNKVPSDPDSPRLLVNQGPIWQQSNERRHWAPNIFFSIILAVFIVLKKKGNDGGKGLKANSESVVRLQWTVLSELQEWLDCSAALFSFLFFCLFFFFKKKEKT